MGQRCLRHKVTRSVTIEVPSPRGPIDNNPCASWTGKFDPRKDKYDRCELSHAFSPTKGSHWN
jgi:hypothetical protein